MRKHVLRNIDYVKEECHKFCRAALPLVFLQKPFSSGKRISKNQVISVEPGLTRRVEPRHDKTNMPSEDSDQPGHLPSLIRVFAVH